MSATLQLAATAGARFGILEVPGAASDMSAAPAEPISVALQHWTSFSESSHHGQAKSRTDSAAARRLLAQIGGLPTSARSRQFERANESEQPGGDR